MSFRTRIDSLVGVRNTSLVALAVTGVLASAAAGAQQAAASDAGGAENLAEIVVTAQKREQRLQEVPIAISVVTGDALDRAGGFNVEGLRQLVPSLNLRKTNTSLNQSLFLRGVGTINFAIAAQPSVAFVLDGVVMSSAGEAFGDLYDADRVEVLRGPQGTLFGKNASAGVVNVVSRRPGREFGGYVDAGWFEDNEIKVKAALDTPLTDAFRGRTTLFYGNFDGYIENVTAGPAGGTVNGYHRKGVRTLWELDASEAVRVTLSADWRKSDDDCCAEIIGTPPNNALQLGALAGTTIAGDEGRQVRTNTDMRQYEEAWGGSVQVDAEIGTHTLTSITAYRTWDTTEIREGDFLDIGAGFAGVTDTADFGPQEQKTWSQELRIASPTGGSFDYVAGLYYSKTEAERFFRRDVTLCSPLAGLAAGAPCPQANWVVASAGATFGADFDNLAVFGDGTFHATDAVRLIAGVRWTQDDLTYFHRRPAATLPAGVTGAPGLVTAGTDFTGGDKSSEVSGRAGVQWDVNDDFMTYATYSRGYKGPAFNVFFNMGQNNRDVIEAETVNAYEVGFKSTLGGGNTIVNAAVFKADYDNFQANNFFFIGTTLVTTLTNAGKVSTQGVELDFLSKPSDILTLSGGIAYTEAEIDEFFTPPGSTPAAVKGDPLPLAPKWKGSLSAEWRLEFTAFDLLPGFTAAYQSEQFSDIGRRADLADRRIAPYGTIDATLAFADKDDRWRFTIVGRNLTDESHASLLQRGGPGGAIRYIIPREADRYLGAQFRLNFGGK